jgi:DNA-directed RNA polymerase specialized sigma24 family protein
MIEQLSLKHDLWVKMARGICKDSYLADDLVSEMYLKLNDYNKDVNEYYIYFTIKHLFINWLREESKYNDIELASHLQDNENEIVFSVKIPECITWVEKQVLLLRQSQSLRDIEKKYHIKKTTVKRIEDKGKQKLSIWANQLKEQGISLQQLQSS